MKILLFIFSLVSLSQVHALGQGYDAGADYDTLGSQGRHAIAEQAIKDLKNGVLVVRLKTGSNKLGAMQRVANSPDVTESERKMFAERIAAYQKEVDQENEWLVRSLKEHYSFSETLYMPDTSAHQLKKGVQSGYFLNGEMQPDPTISLGGKPYLVLFYGNAISPGKSGIEGLVLLDANLKELVEPFPFFSGISTIKRTLVKFFNKKEESEIYDAMVAKLQKRLEEYHQAVD